MATKEADRPTILQCVLDYLYPCRALDPRLNGKFNQCIVSAIGCPTTVGAAAAIVASVAASVGVAFPCQCYCCLAKPYVISNSGTNMIEVYPEILSSEV